MEKIIMKKKQIVLITATLIFCWAYMANARENGADIKGDNNDAAINIEEGRNEEASRVDVKKINKNDNVLGKTGRMFINTWGGCGITYPFAEIHGMGNQTLTVGFSYSAGVKTGLFLFDYGALVFGIDYAVKEFSADQTYIIYPLKTSYSFSFVDLLLGFHGQYRFIYAEIGPFFGIKAGKWREVNKLANIKYTRSSYEKWRHNEVGLYFAAGFLVAVMDDVSIDIGIKYKMSFINAYDNINKYKTTQALITIGITYRFMKKLF